MRFERLPHPGVVTAVARALLKRRNQIVSPRIRVYDGTAR